ncbi:UDP-N-acetylmuramoyl-L-alanine--D-glutamate ligase [Alteromonas facilis]|uniref:UDP-N-acetylmuramoyl-L-alanine--D-glutamate ligase n=1 Tax=Alteromonas facilis TaxID=2048004 RepID=UPI000C282AAA|nr:UDP-N-acetylmuramoyl-L-alanine--D-glutamate ligase [Alteromonas facilis]
MKRFADKHIAIIGAGLTGQSCARYLRQQGASLTIFDTRDSGAIGTNETIIWGAVAEDALVGFDMVVVSPGVSLQTTAIQNALDNGVPVVGDIELFVQANDVPLIAVTGSNGKSTVVSLIGHIFKQAGLKAEVIGNIGRPALDALSANANEPLDWYVLELSSFQLESTHSLKANIASVLNITEDHLDRHRTMEAYRAAKMRIYDGATHCIVNRDDPLCRTAQIDHAITFALSPSPVGMSWNAANQKIYHNGVAVIDYSRCQLIGEHNVLNVQVAYLITYLAGIESKTISAAIEQFKGIAHRYERVASASDVIWINDSKATNPGAALASIKAAKQQAIAELIVIVGGDAKGADMSVLADALADVKYVVALGRDGRQFLSMQPNSVYVDSLQQAVKIASAMAQPNDIVLLAPACASLDMFENYQQRGDVFASAVQEVAA